VAGFRIDETMRGWHEPLDEPGARRRFELRCSWGPDRLGEWLDPRGPGFLWQELTGTVEAEGLTAGPAPARGTLELDYLGARRIRYRVDFPRADGAPLRFLGDKVELRPWNLLVSHTTCTGSIVELGSGRLLSTVALTFRLRDLPRMLLSLRRGPA
jgi:hypothetical protein